MKYNKHNNISSVNTDRMNITVACIADTVLRPLYEFGTNRDLFGYAGALEIVAEWAKEFYALYHAMMEDWDSFEETDENVYNAMSWDEFATYWASDRLKTYLSESGSDPLKQFFGCSRFPKIIIVIKGSTVAAVYSTTPVVYAKIECDAACRIETAESDSVASDLCSLFDPDESIDAAIIQQLREIGF